MLVFDSIIIGMEIIAILICLYYIGCGDSDSRAKAAETLANTFLFLLGFGFIVLTCHVFAIHIAAFVAAVHLTFRSHKWRTETPATKGGRYV